MKPLSLLALLALAPVPQDTYKLEIKARKGDRYTHTSADTNEAKIKIVAGDQEILQETSEREVQKYRDEVLETEGDLPSRVRRVFEEWYSEKKTPMAEEPAKEPRFLQGKTIVLIRKGDKTEYEGAEGAPAKELFKSRLNSIDAFLGDLPKEPVPVGHTWKLDGNKLKEEMSEGEEEIVFSTIQGAGKFARVEEHKGTKCAALVMNLDLEGDLKAQMGMKVRLKLEITILLALDTGRMLTMKGDGTGDITGELAQEEMKMKIDGKLTLKGSGENVYE